jgi:hypothetical protein
VSRAQTVKHIFVESVPGELEAGVLYISMDYATTIHSCLCGCGREVVAPLSPTDWKLVFDGESVSLSPSIGSWSFPCESHYWIKRNRVRWSTKMSRQRIDAGRAKARKAKEHHLTSGGAIAADEPEQRETRTRRRLRRLRRKD